MIYTDQKTIARYRGIHGNLDLALDYLAAACLEELPQGMTEIHGKDVYVNRMQYETIDENEGFYEAHNEYADVHIVLSGKEWIKTASIYGMDCVRKVAEDDFTEYRGQEEAVCRMEPGKVLIAFPEDAHMVKLSDGRPGPVEKAVIKVRINERER